MSAREEFTTGNAVSFASDMRSLVNSKEMSDIKFMIGPSRKVIYAHKCILSARCDVFRAMLSDQQHKHGNGEAPFVLSDTAPETFLIMLEFIYTNCATLSPKSAIDVLSIAIEYGLDGLRAMCANCLAKNLSINTVCETIQAAVTYGQGELKDKALQYVQKNTQKVFQTESFHAMSASALVEILRSNDLDMDEKDILTAVKEWAVVNSAVTEKPANVVAKDVVAHVRLPLLSPEELQTVEEENRKDGLIPMDHLSYAWKCHALKTAERNNPLTTRRKGTTMRESHRGMKIL